MWGISLAKNPTICSVNTAIVGIVFRGAPSGATKRCTGRGPADSVGGEPHANPAAGALGGAPYGGTSRVK
eukprot:29121-Pyramimonas_sp.AAC.1